jgi:hypothetical protein
MLSMGIRRYAMLCSPVFEGSGDEFELTPLYYP